MFVLFAAFERKSFAENIVLRTMLLSDSHASVGMAIARLFFVIIVTQKSAQASEEGMRSITGFVLLDKLSWVVSFLFLINLSILQAWS